MFLEYFNSVKAKKELIRTDDMDVYEMNKSIYNTILKYLNWKEGHKGNLLCAYLKIRKVKIYEQIFRKSKRNKKEKW